MKKILHVIYGLAPGGAPGSMIAVAKHSARLGDFEHSIASLLPPDPQAVQSAEDAGISVFVPQDKDHLLQKAENADIVQVSWWNGGPGWSSGGPSRRSAGATDSSTRERTRPCSSFWTWRSRPARSSCACPDGRIGIGCFGCRTGGSPRTSAACST